MATEINVNGTLTLDQSSGQQTPLTADTGNDFLISANFAELSLDFRTYLNGLSDPFLSAAQEDFAHDVEAAVSGANFITVTQNTANITNLFFSDEDGQALNGDQVFWDPDGNGPDPAVALQTVDGENIYFWSITDDLVIATTSNVSDSDGKLVAAFYLNEAGDHLSASVEMVTAIALAHPDGTDPDDTVNWGDVLNVSASGSLEFNVDNLPSGAFLHATIVADDGKTGLLITGRDPVIKSNGTINNSLSDKVNSSQGGQGATVGIDSQHFDPTNIAVFSFTQTEATRTSGGSKTITNLLYDDFLDVKDAKIFISQLQASGSTPTVSFKVSAFSAGGASTDPEQGFGYIDNTTPGSFYSGRPDGDPQDALADDTPVAIREVKVYNSSNVLIYHKTSDGTVLVPNPPGRNISVTFNANSFTISGVKALDSVEWFTDNPATNDFETFNRFHLEALTGTFDVGKISTSEGITVTTPVGDKLLADDDGPTAAITDTGEVVIHDETAGVQDGSEPEDDNLPDPHTDHDQAGALPAAFAALGAAIGWAQNPSAVVTSAGTDFGTDGAAATDSEVWSLSVPGANTDSTFIDLDGHSILLNVEGDLVVGRVDDDGDNAVDNTDQVAIAIALSQTGILSIAQYIAFGHVPDTGPDQQATMIDSALLAVLTVKDGDDDTHTTSLEIGDKVIIEDDAPESEDLDAASMEEDDLNTALSLGNDDNTSATLFEATVDVDAGVTKEGTDEPVTFNIKDVAASTVLPQLYSKGVALTYHTTLDDASKGGADVIRAYADFGTVDERLVFTFVLTDDGLGDVDATLTLNDQLDHVPFGDDVEGTGLKTDGAPVGTIDFTDLLEGEDKDGDPIVTPQTAFQVRDDVPLFTAAITGGMVDFVAGDSLTSSLNGSVGTDENDANDQAGDGTKTYSFTGFTIQSSSIAGLQGAIIEDGTRVVLFTDEAGGSGGVYDDGIDKLWFDNVLSQAGAGDYLFTVHEDAPDQFLEFEFTGFPSGKQIYGVFGAGTNGAPNPDGPALLVFAEGTNLVNSGGKKGQAVNGGDAGNLVNSSNAQNSGTALAVNNQEMGVGQALFFAYIQDPEADNIVVGVGSSSDLNSAYGDAGFLNFDQMTTEVTTAQVEIAQVTPSGNLVDVQLTAYDITFGSAVDTEDEAIAFLESPLAFDDQVNIDAVRVRDANLNVIEFWQDYDHDGTYELADFDGDTLVEDDPSVNVVFTEDAPGIFSAKVINAADDYTIGFDTETPHDMTLVKNVDAQSHRFDIGGFNLAQGQDTPDQLFDFTVQITDFDGDQDTSNTFEIGVDGTGQFDDDVITV